MPRRQSALPQVQTQANVNVDVSVQLDTAALRRQAQDALRDVPATVDDRSLFDRIVGRTQAGLAAFFPQVTETFQAELRRGIADQRLLRQQLEAESALASARAAQQIAAIGSGGVPGARESLLTMFGTYRELGIPLNELGAQARLESLPESFAAALDALGDATGMSFRTILERQAQVVAAASMAEMAAADLAVAQAEQSVQALQAARQSIRDFDIMEPGGPAQPVEAPEDLRREVVERTVDLYRQQLDAGIVLPVAGQELVAPPDLLTPLSDSTMDFQRDYITNVVVPSVEQTLDAVSAPGPPAGVSMPVTPEQQRLLDMALARFRPERLSDFLFTEGAGLVAVENLTERPFDPETLDFIPTISDRITDDIIEIVDDLIADVQGRIAQVYAEFGVEAAQSWVDGYLEALGGAQTDQDLIRVSRQFVEALDGVLGGPAGFEVLEVPDIPLLRFQRIERIEFGNFDFVDDAALQVVDRLAEQLESEQATDRLNAAFQRVLGLPDVSGLIDVGGVFGPGAADLRAIEEEMEDLARRIELAWTRSFRALGDAAARAFSDVLFDGRNAAEALQSVFRAFADEVLRQLARVGVSQLLGLLGLENLTAGGQVPRRQFGGFVGAGQAYLVGEAGPELFVPSADGTVLPSGAGLANVTLIATGEESDARLDNWLRRRLPDITEAVEVGISGRS